MGLTLIHFTRNIRSRKPRKEWLCQLDYKGVNGATKLEYCREATWFLWICVHQESILGDTLPDGHFINCMFLQGGSANECGHARAWWQNPSSLPHTFKRTERKYYVLSQGLEYLYTHLPPVSLVMTAANEREAQGQEDLALHISVIELKAIRVMCQGFLS